MYLICILHVRAHMWWGIKHRPSAWSSAVNFDLCNVREYLLTMTVGGNKLANRKEFQHSPSVYVICQRLMCRSIGVTRLMKCMTRRPIEPIERELARAFQSISERLNRAAARVNSRQLGADCVPAAAPHPACPWIISDVHQKFEWIGRDAPAGQTRGKLFEC